MSAQGLPTRAPDGFDLASLGEIPDPLRASQAPKNLATEIADPEKIQSLLQSKVASEPHSLTRIEVRKRRWIALSASLAWFVGLLLWAGLRSDFGVNRAALMGQILLPAALGPVALYAALAPGRLGLGQRFEWLVGVTLAAPALFGLLVLATASSFDFNDPKLVGHAVGCAVIAVFLGFVPMVAAAYGLRRVCVTGAPWRSALVGVGIGLASASVLGMHCASSDGLHVLAGHVVPVLVLGLLATVFVRRSARVD